MAWKIPLALLVGLLVVAGVYETHIKKSAPANVSYQPAATMPYQPEAQMLLSATAPGDALQRSERSIASPSKNTKLPYAYQSDLCTNSKDSASHFACLQTYYQNLVDTFGIDVAFSDLKQRYEKDSFVVVQCHPITHVIGREAVKLYPDISDAYLHGDSFCWSGYYHGVLEGIVKNIGQTNLPAKIDTICANIPGRATYNFNYYNCVHGLGHGVMELDGDDVFKSLAMCDNLSGDWEKQSCYSGVFMENIIVFGRDGSSPGLNPADPIYPCTAVAQQYKFQCYLGQTSFVLQQNGGDFKKTFDVCAAVEGSFRDVCGQSIGRDGANYAGHDAQKTKTTCDLTTVQQDSLNCVVGAVKEFISYYHSIDQATAYCNILSPMEKDTCLTTGKAYNTLF